MNAEIWPPILKQKSMKGGFNLSGSIKGEIMNIAKLTILFRATFETGKYILKY
jgi:hypothetical protein